MKTKKRNSQKTKIFCDECEKWKDKKYFVGARVFQTCTKCDKHLQELFGIKYNYKTHKVKRLKTRGLE